MGCQRKIAKKIVDKNADYLLAVKGNQGSLEDAFNAYYRPSMMHWQLDVGFNEDACRIRVDDRAEAFSRIRQACLNLLKSEKSFKGGISRKRMMCAMDEDYLSKVLGSLE